MNQIMYCPHCGKKVGILEEVGEGSFRVLCDSRQGGCGAAGGIANSIDDAVEKWNARGYNSTISRLVETLAAAEESFKQEKERKNNYDEFDSEA